MTAGEKLNRWHPPKISDYWDWQHNALNGGAERLRSTAESRWAAALEQIRSGVRERAEALDDSWLAVAAAIMAEDLYKSFSNQVWRVDAAFRAYLSTSVRAFLDVLTERGFVLQHLIDNAFETTELGMTLPLRAFPVLYECAGFVYACPQRAAILMMEQDGRSESESAGLLTAYAKDGRDVVADVLRRAHAEHRHVVVLEADATARIPEDALRFEGAAGVISVYRDAPPVPGSKCRIVPPRGVVLPALAG